MIDGDFTQPLNMSLLHRVTGENLLCGFNLCARQTVKGQELSWRALAHFQRGSAAGLFFF